MWHLFLEIWLWLVIAFALGWFTHWFLCCRVKSIDDEDHQTATQTKAEKEEVAE